MPRARKHLLPIDPHGAHFHCISRVVDRKFVFGAQEREIFRKILRQVEAFSGVEVLTWTILSNHFHLLVRVGVPPLEPLTDGEILERCAALYTPEQLAKIRWEFESARQAGEPLLALVRARYLKRMWDLSEFMKTLKQRFTGWFNRRQARAGTLWESRFKSVLVEGSWKCLLKVAAYIDLNPVRAGLVDDPKDYRWCGYAEAVAGDRLARRGLAAALSEGEVAGSWRELGKRYRGILFGIGGGTGIPPGKGLADLNRATVAREFAAGGELSLAQLLRCRVRYFTDGLVIGTEAFVEAFFQSKRATFGAARRTGSRKLRGGDWGELRTARALAVDPITRGGDG